MLADGGVANQLPAAIVVGRTQWIMDTTVTPPELKPAYSMGDVTATHTLIVTLTAYNEQADNETCVLLTDTLAPGVTIMSSTVQPDQQGQNLAFSLGTIQGYDRASVTLTLSLPSTIPTQIDTGAQVYATLNAGAVTNSTPAATLRAGSIDPSLLGYNPTSTDIFAFSTDIYDPFVQEEAAKLNYDSTQIYAFLHTQIGYNSYVGSLRGARGTLWSNAGNALDVANLGVDLMRASGIPAQYVSGTLSQADAQTLILSMFPASYQTVGYIPAGTQVSDPANDPQLLAETESHYWFQFDAGGGMTDADPLFPTAVIGQTFSTSTGTFIAIPDALRQTTEIQLQAEMYNQAGSIFAGLLGQSPLTTTTVLDKTFNDADLVGRPLTVGNFVTTSSFGALFLTRTTNTYSPYIDAGDEAYPDGSHDEVLNGTDPSKSDFANREDYQEVITNFPLGNQVLTGLFLDVTLSGLDGPAQTYEHTILDRIGYATRQNGGTPSLTIDANVPPALTELDIVTLNVTASAQPTSGLALLAQESEGIARQLGPVTQALAQPDPALQAQARIQASAISRSALETATASLLGLFISRSDNFMAYVEATTLTRMYFGSPRIIAVSTDFTTNLSSGTGTLSAGLDILRNTPRGYGDPSQSAAAIGGAQFVRGVADSIFESQVLSALQLSNEIESFSSMSIIQAALSQPGVHLVAIDKESLAVLSTLIMSEDAKARITESVLAGKQILVPSAPATVDGIATIAWLEVDPATGNVIAVSENGEHQSYEAVVSRLFGQVEEGVFTTGQGADFAASECVGIAEATAGETAAASGGEITYLQALRAEKQTAVRVFFSFVDPGFGATVAAKFLLLLASSDPPAGTFLSKPLGLSTIPTNETGSDIVVTGQAPLGVIQGLAHVASISMSQQIEASWSAMSETAFQTGSLIATRATVDLGDTQAIGTGTITLTVAHVVQVTVSGNVAYTTMGTGTLSFYGPAESSLGVSGDWQNYTATVTGDVSIKLTVPDGALTLNGQSLPAGTYTITTNSATLSGSGTMSSPTFSGSVAITATNGAINLGPGTGTLAVGAKPLDPKNETTLDGYNGTINVAANGDGTDAVTLNGNAGNVLQVILSPATLSTDQNTPVTFQTNVQTSFADTYTLTANAPVGWTVTIDANGKVIATPAPGVQSGTYPIQIIAQSTTDPNLIAQNIVNVTITATQPGLALNVASDPIFTVPYNGAQLPTAFRASIQNLGPAVDTYNLTFSGVPSGFTLLNSGTSVTVPAGQTGILGLYLQPTPGQPIPPVGSQISFTVTATSTTDSSLTKSQVVTFTVPAIDGVTATVNSSSLTSTSGSSATSTLTLTNVGNVAENVTPTATLALGVTASGLAPVTIQPGQSMTETITLTPDSTVPLNTPEQITFTASYGQATPPLTTTATLSLVVRSAQVAAIQEAANAVSSLPNSQIGGNLSELADALASLQATPTDATLLNRVQFLLKNLGTLIQADPALASFVSQFQPLQVAASSGDVSGLFSQTAAFFNDLAPVLTEEADQQFTATLSPNEADLSSGQGQTFNLQLTSTSPDPIALTLGTGALPSGVTAVPGQTQVTLMPGQTLMIPVVMTQTIASTKFFTLDVTASASVIPRTAMAFVAIRPATADVLSVTATPVAANPGDSVAVSASIFNTANATRTLLARVDVLDATGKVVSSSANIPFNLVPSAAPISLDLGSISTTGLSNGLYSTRVSLLTIDGVALPGRTAQRSFEIGAPVSASVTQSTVSVPPGSSSVSTSLTVTDQLTTGTVAPAKFGDIQVFYSAANSFGLADNLDGAVFVIENTSGTDINNGVLSINPPGGTPDSFNVGTIKAGGRAIIQPGISDDGGTNHTFFAHTGTLVDESDQGPNSDATSFDFKGTQGVYFLDSGNFTPAATKGPSVDDPNYLVNFLGGPGDHDAPTHDFAPKVVANLYGTFQQPPGLTVEVGYADNLRANPFFPNPWNGAPNTIFAGGGSSFDTGAVRIINDGTAPVTINDVTILLPGGQKFDLWGSNTVPAGGNLILTQTGSYNFDTSDYGTLPFPQTYPDGETAHAARVIITVNGQAITLLDTGHVLTTGGSDLAAGGANESQNWRPIGTTGISNPNGSSLAVVITDNLPATGYNVDPATISPTASTVSAAQVVWTPPPLTESVPTTFQLSGTVTNIAPGEVRQISTGSSVVATTFAPNGTPIQTTLPFGPLVVAADHIISLTPPIQSIERAGTSTFMVTLANPLSTSETYTLSTQGLDEFSTQLAGTVTVAAGQTVTVPLTVTAPPSVLEGPRGFVVSALTSEGGTDSAEGQLTVSSTVALPVENVFLSLSPTKAVAGPATPVTFQVIVTNTGDETTTYDLSGAFPTGFAGTFSPSSVTVPPGGSNSRTVLLTITPPANASAGDVPFSVTATSTDAPTVSGSAIGTVTVVQNGVRVMLSPPTGSPGDTFTMTVTNTGSVTDTYDLAPAGPVGLVATLSQTKVTLAPGASQDITITTSAINFAVPGPIDLTAIATSEGNPSVVGAASSVLTIGKTQGLTGSLSPSAQILTIPGTTSFLLLVNNTGNTEDSYTASITGSSGPVAANLIGLDGNPTQSIPLFRLPGLSTGAILIPTNLSAFGTGTVSVTVTSLSNNALTASETATVSAALVATNTQLVVSPNPATVGQAVTFTAMVAPTSGNGTPTGTVTFSIDGKAQSPVGLIVTNGTAQATFSTSMLTLGQHAITASYSGNAPFAPSFSDAMDEVVNPAAFDDPPTTGVNRYGYHWMPTTLALTFNQALDPATAQDAKDYRIIGPAGRIIGVRSAVYNAATNTVTLHPRERINIHHRYTLFVEGAKPGGLTNTTGQLLDGTDSGKPGSDYRAPLTWHNLVLDPPLPKTSGRSTTTTTSADHRPKSDWAHAVSHKAGLFTRPLAFRR